MGLFSRNEKLAQPPELNILTFEIKNVPREQLNYCQIGDYVNLWTPPDSTEVCIFRKGTVGGTGKLGWAPKKESRLIYSQLANNLGYETEIVAINLRKSTCCIRCKLFTKEEMKAKAELVAKNLDEELKKKYTPRGSISFKLRLPKDHSLKENQILSLVDHPIDYYIERAENLQLDFVDENGNIVAKLSYASKTTRSILRAYFNGYILRFRITNIEKPDQQTIKYIETVDSNVELTFSK